MNRHFEDALYYLKRAVETTKRGVGTELAPVETKLREVTGREREPEPGRIESVVSDLDALRERVADGARDAFDTARDALAQRRPRRS